MLLPAPSPQPAQPPQLPHALCGSKRCLPVPTGAVSPSLRASPASPAISDSGSSGGTDRPAKHACLSPPAKVAKRNRTTKAGEVKRVKASKSSKSEAWAPWPAPHPMPRDTRPDTAVLERAVNAALYKHVPHDRHNAMRRMINDSLRPHTGAAVFSVDRDAGAETRALDWMMSWIPSRPRLRKAIAEALLEGGLQQEAPIVALDAADRHKVLVRPALERLLATRGQALVDLGELADVGSARTMNCLRELAMSTLAYARLYGRETAAATYHDVSIELVSANATFQADGARGCGAVYDSASRIYLQFGLEEARDRCTAAVARAAPVA